MSSKKQLLLLSILILSFFICFWSTLKGLYYELAGNDDYSYALFIPLISAYIIWEKRKAIAETPISVHWLGGLFLLFFMVISAYGIVGSSPSAVRPSLPFILMFITLFCFGRELFKILVLPFSLFFFMIPFPTVVETWIGLPLKSVSTKLGEFMLHAIGISVFIEGNILDLGVCKLEVVNACNGLRYLLPLLALGVVFAYFFEKVKWKQYVIVISTIPLAIIMNGFRIATTGALAQWYGPKTTEGVFHAFFGWLVFIFAFAVLFIFHYVMKRFFKNDAFDSTSGVAHAAPTSSASLSRDNSLPVALSSVLLILVGILGITTAALPSIVLADGFTRFPMVIGDWKGEHSEIIAREMIEKSGAEQVFSALYKKNKDSDISLYIGYRGSPFLESENFFHSPNVCLPSSGWKIVFTRKHRIPDVLKFGSVVVSELAIEKMGYRQLVYFWFQTKNRISHDVNINRYHLTLHAIARDNTYDLFIRPITPMGQDDKIEDAELRMDQFVRDMMPALLNFMNDKQVTG